MITHRLSRRAGKQSRSRYLVIDTRRGKTRKVQEKRFKYLSLCTKTRFKTEVRETRKSPIQHVSLGTLMEHRVNSVEPHVFNKHPDSKNV